MIHKSVFHVNDGSIILFKNWVLVGPKETYLSCILLAILGITYQALRFARQRYGRRCHNLQCQRYILNKGHIIQTAMYILQFVWGYFLMLSVMTFNLWVLCAVLVGFGLGYFLFGWCEFEERRFQKPGVRSANHVCRTGVGITQKLLSPSNISSLSGDAPSSSIRCVCDETPI